MGDRGQWLILETLLRLDGRQLPEIAVKRMRRVRLQLRRESPLQTRRLGLVAILQGNIIQTRAGHGRIERERPMVRDTWCGGGDNPRP